MADNDLEALGAMNAQMRRIDLLCKLLGPLFIALLNGYSTELAIAVNFAINAVSIGLEYFAIAKVYKDTPNLQNPKPAAETETDIPVRRNRNWILDIARKSVQDFGLYFGHHAFFPSIAEAILYLTVLSFSGQMITYLLSAGYNSAQIGISRTLSVIFEVLATWIGPWLMGRIGALRAGLWMSIWQVVTLVTGVSIFWIFESKPFISASGLVCGTILSRIGLRGFDLCVQFIIQKVCMAMGNPDISFQKPLIDSIPRKSSLRTVGHSPRSKQPGKMPLGCSPTQQLLFSLGLINSNGLLLFRLRLSLRQVPYILPVFTCVEAFVAREIWNRGNY